MALLETDPVDLALDAFGDLAIGDDGDLVWTRGLDAVAQGVRIAVSLIRGEWFLDLGAGIPYFERDGVDATQALLGQPYDDAKVRREFRNAILAVPGVGALEELVTSFNGNTRELTIRWTVRAEFGGTVSDSLALGT